MSKFVNQPGIITAFSYIPAVFYVISAGVLAIIAASLLYEGITITVNALSSETITRQTTEIFTVIFHAATAIALLETVGLYFKSHRIAIEGLLLAGVAELIRHILVYDINGINPGDFISLVILPSSLDTITKDISLLYSS